MHESFEQLMEEGACADQEVGLMFPDLEDALGQAVAKAVCEVCPIKSDCLDYAMTVREPAGIWGGTNERDRQRIRRVQSRRLRSV